MGKEKVEKKEKNEAVKEFRVCKYISFFLEMAGLGKRKKRKLLGVEENLCMKIVASAINGKKMSEIVDNIKRKWVSY